MTDRNQTEERWRARIKYGLRAFVRDAKRLEGLTLTQAPPELNRPHLDYMLRPSHVQQVTDALTSIATGIYQVEVQARYRRHRPDDEADLRTARQHLTHAAQALHRISQRGKGHRT
jgi:hypothetical protein